MPYRPALRDPKRNHTSVHTIALRAEILLCLLALSLQAQSPAAKASTAQIELRLAIEKTSFPLGFPILAEVRVINRGAERVFVPVEFQEGGFPAYLQIRVEDANGRLLPSIAGAVEKVVKTDVSFSGALVENWVALPPGYFIGTTLDISALVYTGVKKPGRYRIRARLSPAGPHSANQNNPLLGRQDEIHQLPFASWEGEFQTNVVWIEITSSPNQSKPSR